MALSSALASGQEGAPRERGELSPLLLRWVDALGLSLSAPENELRHELAAFLPALAYLGRALTPERRQHAFSAPRARSLVLAELIAELDERIHAQVNALLASPPLRALESAWRSLDYLVDELPEDELIRVRVLNASHEELLADFDDAVDFDRSSLFELVYDQEYGRLAGEPYALLVSELEFGPGVEDASLLRDLAAVASAAHAVLLAGAGPELLGLPSWSALSLRALANDLQDKTGFVAWNSLRAREDARYVGLVMPRVLLRAPYRPGDGQHLRLPEHPPADVDARLWGSGAFVLAARAMHAFHAYAWPVAIRGLNEGFGVASGLPEEDGSSDRPGLVLRPPVEVVITEAQERLLTELGLIPLCRVAGSPKVAFFTLPSLHLSAHVTDASVAANLQLAAQLPNVLAASRFAHYLKMILQANVGSFSSRQKLQEKLSEFLAEYTLDDPQATPERKAGSPLRSFELQLRDRPGRPGVYDLTVQLQAQFQIQEPNIVLRLTMGVETPQ